MGDYAENVMCLAIGSMNSGLDLREVAVGMNMDLEDPTHQAYLEAADQIIYFYWSIGNGK